MTMHLHPFLRGCRRTHKFSMFYVFTLQTRTPTADSLSANTLLQQKVSCRTASQRSPSCAPISTPCRYHSAVSSSCQQPPTDSFLSKPRRLRLTNAPSTLFIAVDNGSESAGLEKPNIKSLPVRAYLDQTVRRLNTWLHALPKHRLRAIVCKSLSSKRRRFAVAFRHKLNTVSHSLQSPHSPLATLRLLRALLSRPPFLFPHTPRRCRSPAAAADDDDEERLVCRICVASVWSRICAAASLSHIMCRICVSHLYRICVSHLLSQLC
jgi:hypothetical protein